VEDKWIEHGVISAFYFIGNPGFARALPRSISSQTPLSALVHRDYLPVGKTTE
jgi:hypothetical protein